MKHPNKRWAALFAGVLIELCLGLPYSWSVFQNLLSSKYNWSIPRTAFAYSLSSIFMLIFTLLFSSTLMKKLGIRRFLMVGCLCYAGGTIGCGLIQSSVLELYLYYGLLIGTGTAIMYPTLTSYAVRLFPDKAGLASGIMVAGYGCGPFIIAPIVQKIYEATGDISKAFLLLGTVFLVSIFLLCLFIYEPEAQTAGVEVKREVDHNAYTRKQMIRSPLFYVIYGVFLIGILNGTMLVTQASPILQNLHGISASAAAGMVGIFSISNTTGRIFWGAVSDKIGKQTTLVLLHIFVFLGFGTLLLIGTPKASILAIGIAILSYGGFSSILAPMTSYAFGASTLAANYSIMFSIFSFSGIIGPMLITNAGYRFAFVYGSISSIVGIVIAVSYARYSKRQKASCAQTA